MSKIRMLLENFITDCQLKHLRPKTIKSYEQSLMLFSDYLKDLQSIQLVEEIQAKHVLQYIRYLQERGKYSVAVDEYSFNYNHPKNRQDYGKKISDVTINNYIRNIKVFFSFSIESGEISKNPMSKIKQFKTERKPLNFISDEKFLNLIKHMDRSKFSEYRDWAIIQLLLDTGMRIGETLLTKISDIDLIHRTVYIPVNNTKGGKSRSVFFCVEMQKILKSWLKFQDRYRTTEYLFCTNEGNPVTISNFETNFRKYTKRVGLENVHPHVLRNNFAKRFLMTGGNIFTLSKILGHSSVDVTEKSYLDLDDEDLRQGYQQFSPLANLKKINKTEK